VVGVEEGEEMAVEATLELEMAEDVRAGAVDDQGDVVWISCGLGMCCGRSSVCEYSHLLERLCASGSEIALLLVL
jgi:hypothetical protein